MDIQAARSPMKVLTHLDLIRANAEFCRNRADPAAHSAEILRAAQIEFHPCDACNLTCKGCTYNHDESDIKPPPLMFPLRHLGLLGAFHPRALVVTGGGEPMLYRDPDTQANFDELIKILRALLPDCKFALITNGTRELKPLTGAQFHWMRISVDAATAETYQRVRGRDRFNLVCKNLLAVLRGTQIPQVNVGFVFSAENGDEVAETAQFFRHLVLTNCPAEIGRLCIDYRPIRRDPADRHSRFPDSITKQQRDIALKGFAKLRMEDGEFLYRQTNYQAVVIPEDANPSFGRCGYAGIYRLIRANGDVRPCCMRLREPAFDLGNLLRDAGETLAGNILQLSRGMPLGCGPASCRLSNLNRVIEDGITGKLAAPPEIQDSPFF